MKAEEQVLPESSPEHKAAKAALDEARSALDQLSLRVEKLKDQERRLRPFCPKCKSMVGEGTIKVLGGGGDYEDWPCPLCCPEEYRRCVAQAYY